MPSSKLLKELLYLATCIHYKVDALNLLTIQYINQDLYKAIYGFSAQQTAVTWEIIETKFIHPKTYKKMHLLWALRFLTYYQTKHYLSHELRHFPETIAKSVWYTIKCLAKLNVVSELYQFIFSILCLIQQHIFKIKLSNSFLGCISNQRAFLTVDGRHFMMYEPNPFDCKCFSHNFKHSDLTYKIGVNVQTGDIF